MPGDQQTYLLTRQLALHDFYLPKDYLNKDFKDVMGVLLDSFNESYGFPLILERKEADYYPSVTSTILISLYHMKVIDENFKNRICDSIFSLRDYTPNKIVKQKDPEDLPAWDVSESANCWTTSLVIEAFLETGYSGEKINEIKDATVWLTDQQRDDNGFGFDITCISRVFITARVLYALHLGKKLFSSRTSERRKIQTTIKNGISFIEEEMKPKGSNIVYWSAARGQDEPDPTSTVMALWILSKLDKLDEDVKKRALNYLRRELRNSEIWDLKTIAEEVSTKYGSHKIIVSFTPSIPLVLLDVGVDAMDELCMKPVLWLKNNFDNGWKLPLYLEGIPSFTYALGLWTIMKWHRLVARSILTRNIENDIFKKLRKRIKATLILVSILFILASRYWVFRLMYYIYKAFYGVYVTHGLLIMLASIITIIGGLLGLQRVLTYTDRRFFDQKYMNSFRQAFKKVFAWIYAK